MSGVSVLSNFVPAARPADGGASRGAAGSPQIRLAEHGYPDGGATLAGTDRPGPRDISNKVFSQLDSDGDLIPMPNSGGFSSLLWVWGQFLDHDLTQTATSSASGAAPFTAPADDPVFAPGSILRFSRSEFVSGTGTGASDPREFANRITAFIDGSNLYGSDAAKLAALLEPGAAKLRLGAEGTIGFASGSPVFGSGPIAGDTRADENVALLSMHALFAREHNRIVDELATLDPGLSTAQLFEGARARVEAILQAITYDEFLPILIGEEGIEDYSGFKSSVDPAISLEFSTAIYRFGHSLLSPMIARMNEDGSTHAAGNLALRDAFQQRGVVERTGIEAILRGMSATRAQELDSYMVEDVRSLLFGAGGPGLDLAALSIQRGRDHGLPSYNEMRVALGLEPRTSFGQITADEAVAARLEAAYGDVSGLDLLVGGLAEDSVAGGMMGETFRLVMIDQFTRLRDGDRFWSQARGFGEGELAELWATTLSDVILRNTDVQDLQDDAFLAYARRAGGAGDDTLAGGAGRNLLIGNGGDDRLTGGGREDHLTGGAGADRLDGREGDDKLLGGGGADSLTGAQGADALYGDASKDGLSGGGGADFLSGGAGGDALDGGAGTDSLSGGRGGDLLRGREGADTLDEGSGHGELQGGDGRDSLFGGRGRDVLEGGHGNDELSGGAGGDLFRFVEGAASGRDVVTDFDASGNDLIRLDGFAFAEGLSGRARLRAVAEATSFDKSGVTIDLAQLGGEGEIRLIDVDDLSFKGGEDFLFG